MAARDPGKEPTVTPRPGTMPPPPAPPLVGGGDGVDFGETVVAAAATCSMDAVASTAEARQRCR